MHSEHPSLRHGRTLRALGVALFVWLGACHAETETASPATMSAQPGERPAFCERLDHATEIDTLFCAAAGPPPITSLRDLQRALDLDPFAHTQAEGAPTHTNAVVLLGLSTSLPGHHVSPLNPRAFVLGRNTTLAYVRGTQEVELVSQKQADPAELVFYLLRYRQRCNSTDAGCSFGDLYTPATESDWTSVTLQDDEELENTPFDCRACHARGGARSTLLMREVDGPWTHFFDSQKPERSGSRPELTGYDLLQDYLAAKGGEPYAGIDVQQLEPSTPQELEIAAGLDQPLYFDSLGIERERWPLHNGGYEEKPQPSAIWEAAYAAFKRGEQLPLPHFDPRPTSADKQARLTDAYTRYRNHDLDAEELPDLSDIFPDEPALRAQIGLQIEPDATPVETLIQACGPCHNNVLTQNLSRARFNIDLERMPQAELEAAAARIELPPTAAGAMPPLTARALTQETRSRLADYLRNARPVDARLIDAAKSGMMGGSRPRR